MVGFFSLPEVRESLGEIQCTRQNGSYHGHRRGRGFGYRHPGPYPAPRPPSRHRPHHGHRRQGYAPHHHTQHPAHGRGLVHGPPGPHPHTHPYTPRLGPQHNGMGNIDMTWLNQLHCSPEWTPPHAMVTLACVYQLLLVQHPTIMGRELGARHEGILLRPHRPGRPVRSISCSAPDCNFTTTTDNLLKQNDDTVHKIGQYPCTVCWTLQHREWTRKPCEARAQSTTDLQWLPDRRLDRNAKRFPRQSRCSCLYYASPRSLSSKYHAHLVGLSKSSPRRNGKLRARRSATDCPSQSQVTERERGTFGGKIGSSLYIFDDVSRYVLRKQQVSLYEHTPDFWTLRLLPHRHDHYRRYKPGCSRGNVRGWWIWGKRITS